MNADAHRPEPDVLVHVCCATCYLKVADDLHERRVDFEGFFYNPNIHPLLEFRRRLKACKVLAHDVGLSMRFDEDYGLFEWLREVAGHEDRRCDICYRMRLTRTAQVARDEGFAAFTTTLLVSPEQRHEALHRMGEEIADQVGIKFLYHDWRPLYESACAEAKDRSLYRQQYCGCIFSEYERYRNTGKHLWRPPNRS